MKKEKVYTHSDDEKAVWIQGLHSANACEQAAREAEDTVILGNSPGKTENEVELLGRLKEQKVDAMIQLG